MRFQTFLKFSRQAIRKAPTFGNAIDNCFLHGLANYEDKLVILLAMNSLLDENELYQTTPLKKELKQPLNNYSY